jgi:transposase InsO family protein
MTISKRHQYKHRILITHGLTPESCTVANLVKEAKVIVEDWRLEYNNRRPRSGLYFFSFTYGSASGIKDNESGKLSNQSWHII